MAEAAAPQSKPPRTARVVKGTPLTQLQAKLEVGPAGDRYEREADSVAARVMQGGAAPMAIPPSITPLGAQRKVVKPREDEKAKTAQRKTAPMPKEEEKRGKTAQRKAAPKPKDDDKRGLAQRDAAAGVAGGTASGAVAASVAAMQSGSASGLDSSTRHFMEGRFGRDLGAVRVHSGPRAAAAADALGARAFTVGRDIFFNAGQYQPQASTGRHLLAHELTHTVQQTGDSGFASRKRVQRLTEEEKAKAGGAGGAAPTSFDIPSIPGAKVDVSDTGGAKGTITVPTLGLPAVAGAHKGTAGGKVTPVASTEPARAVPTIGAPLSFNKPMPRRDHESVPAQVWTEAARGDATTQAGIKARLTAKITPAAASVTENGKPVYYLKLAEGGANQIYIGTVDELAQSDAILRPQWSDKGKPLFGTERFDADHFLEMQLGGGDVGANMWLLQASYNRSVGSKIASNMRTDINSIVNQAKPLITNDSEEPLSYDEVRTQWNVTFTQVAEGSGFSTTKPTFWTRDQIKAGDQVEVLQLMTEDDLIAAGIRLASGQQPTAIKVFPSLGGGWVKSLTLGPNGSVMKPADGELFKGIQLNSGTYIGNQPLDAPESDLMTLNVTVMKTRKTEGEEVIERKTGDVSVKRAPRLGIAGYISRASIMAAAGTTRFKSMSPLVFADLGVTPEGVLAGTGSIGSTKLMLPGLNVPLTLYGDRIGLNFPVPTENLSLGPVTVTEAGLSLGVGDKGFFVEGYAGFEVRSLGTGMVTAALTEAGPELSGSFALAMDFLNPAMVTATYNLANDTFSAQATLGVQQGKIPGVDSGTVTVAMTRDTVAVNGTINLGGVLRGTVVNVTYNDTAGLMIGATNIPLPLASLPAVQNATMSIQASKPPNAEAWSFAGQGSATLSVPGATGMLAISYLDGAITVHGTGIVQKGPATGTLDFTATNRQIDAEGRPIDGPLTDGMTAWGRGTVIVRFGELLTGTAGIELTPDNRVILSGTIAMPPVYEVFGRRDYTKDIFTLSPPEFPIWGVSVGGVGVGIFAFVDARLFFEAFVGPGQIRDAAVTATLDLDRPEEAQVQGHGEFYVPAYAGFGLDVGGGLRARVAVAYAQGRVGLTGRLGVEAGAGAIIDFDWSRASGLSLAADLHAEATPKFDLSATASVTVGVDLLLTELEHTWGPWSQQLGSFGPDMTLGVTLPVKWSESGGLDLSLDNIVITRPQLDAGGLMSDVFDRLAG